jgi:hypothetical protein
MSQFARPQSLIVITLIALTGLSGITILGQTRQEWSEQAQLDFLKKHWQVPIALQGKPPADWSSQEGSLAPETCGSCHPVQFNDWKTTVHSHSVGPGLLGQTPTLLLEDPSTAQSCYQCHAPLAEQQEVIAFGAKLRKNTHFDATLQAKGLTCAACHVRKNQRFGPPRRDGSLVSSKPPDQLSHGGATRTPAFERAEFCRGCHQFEPDGYALNGKLLENTYNEWKNGPYAAQGIQCQQCHMPDRRHLWRGIHDVEMVRSGVNIDLQLSQQKYSPGDKLDATLTLMNSGVGHYFPTYVTPRIVLRMEILDGNRQVVADTIKEKIVGRQITLDLDREIADTRIPPKGVHTFRYSSIVNRAGLRLHAEVIVYPDEFYTRFYEAKLAGRLSLIERQRLSQALQDSHKAVYKLFEKEVPL